MNGIEREFKLRFDDPLLWDSIENARMIREAAVPGTFRVERHEARYYDTEGLDLNNAGLSFRVRRENGRPVATVKERGTLASGGFAARPEWSVGLAADDGGVPDIACFRDLPVRGAIEAALRGKGPLRELFASRFERKILNLRMPGLSGGLAEFAADKGAMIAGERVLPIQEIELEIIDADLDSVARFAAGLAAEFQLIPEERSKFGRGLELAGLKRRSENA